MRVPPWVVCVFPGVFLSSRVTGACPVTTDLIMRVNMRTITTTTTTTTTINTATPQAPVFLLCQNDGGVLSQSCWTKTRRLTQDRFASVCFFFVNFHAGGQIHYAYDNLCFRWKSTGATTTTSTRTRTAAAAPSTQ